LVVEGKCEQGKKNGCFQCPLKQPHEVFQNNSSVTEKNFSPEHWFNF
jgi:hypothetical protein